MNPTTWSERVGDEVYVYVRGVLVMKRWLSTGVSRVFYETGRRSSVSLQAFNACFAAIDGVVFQAEGLDG